MTQLKQDLRDGAVIGFKLALTGYLIVTVICVAFTGLGFIVAPMVMTGGLDTIWGRE
jgi:hypothetical protein